MKFEDMIKALNDEYLATLPDKVRVIRTQAAQVDPIALRETFHKLKGTGRTYGLPEVSVLAEAAENVCRTSPAQAAHVAGLAAGLLLDIHAAHLQSNLPFALAGESRFQQIQKLL